MAARMAYVMIALVLVAHLVHQASGTEGVRRGLTGLAAGRRAPVASICSSVSHTCSYNLKASNFALPAGEMQSCLAVLPGFRFPLRVRHARFDAPLQDRSYPWRRPPRVSRGALTDIRCRWDPPRDSHAADFLFLGTIDGARLTSATRNSRNSMGRSIAMVLETCIDSVPFQVSLIVCQAAKQHSLKGRR